VALALAATGATAASAASGCGGDEPDGDGPDISGLGYTPCAADRRVGGFEVDHEADYTAVFGRVADAVDPIAVPVVVAEGAGGACRVLEAPNYACAPACAPADTCSAALVCVPRPRNRDVGAVTVVGLVDEVVMTAIPPLKAYNFAGALAHPGVLPGAKVVLSTAGGDAAPFRLRGLGVDALGGAPAKVVVAAGQALALTWTPAASADPIRIVIRLEVNTHGAVGTRLECTVPDSGAFEVPEPIVTALVGRGVSGFPRLSITRQSLDAVTTDLGCVDFRIHRHADVEVEIPGLVSCSDAMPCPMGQTCQGDLTCK
jgi:hypothetical protein